MYPETPTGPIAGEEPWEMVQEYNIELNRLDPNSKATRKGRRKLAISDEGLFKEIWKYRSPVFLSSDAGLRTKENGEKEIVATVVASVVDMRGADLKDPKTWKNKPAIPIIARTARVPTRVGTTEVDINYGELVGILMGDDMWPRDRCAILVTDSENARRLVRTIREDDGSVTFREKVRHIYPQISKSLARRAETNIQHWRQTRWQDADIEGTNTTREVTKAITDMAGPNYKMEEADEHDGRPCIHVGSHQLSDKLATPKDEKGKAGVGPCYLVAHTNWWADAICTETGRSDQRKRGPHPPAALPIDIPTYSMRFGLTHKGRYIDGKTTAFFDEMDDREQLIKLSRRAKQGWWARNRHRFPDPKEAAGRQGLLHGVLSHTATSHTRMYRMSKEYREECDRTGVGAEEQCTLCMLRTRGLRGTTRHLHTQCDHPALREIREEAAKHIHEAWCLYGAICHHAPVQTENVFIQTAAKTMTRCDEQETLATDGTQTPRTRVGVRTDVEAWTAATAWETAVSTRCIKEARRAFESGMIPVPEENVEGDLTSVTDMLYAGILPKEVHQEMEKTHKAFAQYQKGGHSAKVRDEHYHNQCHADSTLKKAFTKRQKGKKTKKGELGTLHDARKRSPNTDGGDPTGSVNNTNDQEGRGN